MWTVFTNIGDAAVTLPVAAICAAWIARLDTRLACRWIALLAAAMAMVGATKILYYGGWSLPLAASGFRVVSGHTMLSTSVWIVAITLQLKWWRLPPLLGIVAGMAIGVLTGIARVMDQSHSLPEVLSGWVLGALVAAVFLRSALKDEFDRPQPKPMWSAISLLLVSAFAYGHKAPLQDLIETHAPEIHRRAPSVAALFHPIRYRCESHDATPAR
jgi:membrane-associated phospholipid phosphatase